MGKLIKRIVLEDFRWHDLRHCSASYMRQDGLSLGHIGNWSQILGVYRALFAPQCRRNSGDRSSHFQEIVWLNAYENAYEGGVCSRKPLQLQGFCGARRGTRTLFPILSNPAIARLCESDPPFVCIFVCIQPYNFLEMAAPVSRVSSALRCE